MTEWVKRLQGYVKIRVWGFAPQRFINLCSNKGILLWHQVDPAICEEHRGPSKHGPAPEGARH